MNPYPHHRLNRIVFHVHLCVFVNVGIYEFDVRATRGKTSKAREKKIKNIERKTNSKIKKIHKNKIT